MEVLWQPPAPLIYSKIPAQIDPNMQFNLSNTDRSYRSNHCCLKSFGNCLKVKLSDNLKICFFFRVKHMHFLNKLQFCCLSLSNLYFSLMNSPALGLKSCLDRLESFSTMKWTTSALRTWPMGLESLPHPTTSSNQVWLVWIIIVVVTPTPQFGS